MGMLDLFFNLAIECFDVLAWPLFALGYPIWASIQAIETNSISEIRKLITYWVSLSLILIFEELLKLSEWIPFWHFLKLILAGCLVAPYFDGSVYVYKRIIHPCLSADPQIVINVFIKLKELFLEKYNLLVVIERDVIKEHEPEALENLIASKPCSEAREVAKNDISAVEIREKKEKASAKKIRKIQPDLASAVDGVRAALEIKDLTASMASCRDVTPPCKSISKEWTCPICQVTTTSEEVIISHLQGRRHEVACETLKAKNQMLQNENSAGLVKMDAPQEMATAMESGRDLPCKTRKCIQLVEVKTEAKETKLDASDNFIALDSLPAFKQKLKETKAVKDQISVAAIMETKEVTSTKQVKQIEPEFGLSGNRTCGSVEIKEMTDVMLASRDFDILPSKNIRKEWTCAICEVTAASETDFISHLQGNLHKGLKATSKQENQTSMKAGVNLENKDMDTAIMTDGGSADKQHSTNMQKPWICAVCQETATSETDFILHLQGRQHESAFEKLNPKNQSSSAKFPASVEENVLLDGKDIGTATITSIDIPDKQHSKGVQKMLICSVCPETAANVTDFVLHLGGKQHVDACGKLKTKEQPLKSNVSLASAATSAPPESGCDLPDKPQFNNSKSLWTCALCDIATTSKMDLISHFQGMWHKNSLDLLKVKIATSRNNILPENRETAGSNLPGELHGNKNFQKPWTCGICQVTVSGEATVVSHLEGRKHLNACKKPNVPLQTSKRAVSPAPMGQKSDSCEEVEKHESGNMSSWTIRNKQIVERRNSLWWCKVCNRRCSSEGTMDCHLNGRKHLAKSKKLSIA